MSHYVTYVIIPPDSHNIEFEVGKQMEPYNTMLDIEEYEIDCHCVRQHAVEVARKSSKWKTSGPFFLFTRKEFSVSAAREALKLGHPDPDCESCKGSGISTSVQNPDQFWDFWSIGEGFVDGILEECILRETEDRNIVPIADLDLEKLPLPDIVLTPHGEWLSQEEFAWMYTALIVDEDWKNTVKNTLRRHKDCLLVVVNCHN